MAKRVRLRLNGVRNNPEFMQFLKDHAWVNPVTGEIKVKGSYAYIGFNISWKGKPVSVTYANAVWFLTHGIWPKPGHHIDHVDDDSLNNRPDNLQEITEAQNQAKRRGKKVYRSYGKGEYGYGLQVHFDKRDGRFYVSRNLSRGHGNGDLKHRRYSLGGFDSYKEAKSVIAAHVEVLKLRGIDYIPSNAPRSPKRVSVILDSKIDQMREMRKSGMAFQAIADQLGLKIGAVYKRIRDI